MKRIILLATFILIGLTSVWAQQDPLFTQYMTNPMSINPAIAGTREVHNLSLISRKQWLGIDGSPTTVSLAYQGPFFNEQVGLGANLIHDRLGPVAQTGLYFDYAYKLLLDEEKESRLSLGVMGGFNYYVYNLLGLNYNGFDDDIWADGYNDRFLLNFGIGAFYYSPKYFVGVSIPKILRNSLSEAENTLTIDDREERHYFAMAGYVFTLNENIKLKPSFIGRIVNGAPASLDLNATLMLYDKIWLGGMYRLGSSFGGIVRWQINDKMHLGYSFDLSTNRLNKYNSGTHEVFISFDFGSDKEILNALRFF